MNSTSTKPTGSYTIDEWCARHRTCRSNFYKLQREGNGPKTYRIGSVQRISEAADTEWVRDREARNTNPGGRDNG